MKKTALLLVILFAVTTAFKGGDKRELIKCDIDCVSELLRNNGTIVSSNLTPQVMEAARHTWVSPTSKDEKTLVLYSNQGKAHEANCDFTNYWFLEGNNLKTSNNNTCEKPNTIVIADQNSYAYSLFKSDGSIYLKLSDESGTMVHKYMVKSVEKVTYKKHDQTGYEITLVKWL